MILQELTALNFRNYEKITIELPCEGALFLGVNGSGKTNLLEAISFALLGKSPRTSSIREMIRLGEREAYVKAKFSTTEGLCSQSIGFSREKQVKVSHNDISGSSLSDLYGENRFIYFGPDDIILVTGTPEEKRRFLDLTISQVSTEYLLTLIKYRKILRQRNTLLTGKFDPVLCDIYDKELAVCMSIIVAEREKFFLEISKDVTDIYNRVCNSESEVTVQFAPSICFSSAEDYENALRERRYRDLENGFTSIGPHRDNFRCKKDGRSIIGFGSQGQCRSSALALKIASTNYLTRDDKELILAVDDAFSDLDKGRREKFFAEISNRGQLFIAVHSEEERSYYPLTSFSISNGRISQL